LLTCATESCKLAEMRMSAGALKNSPFAGEMITTDKGAGVGGPTGPAAVFCE